jgi:hypothetical protein
MSASTFESVSVTGTAGGFTAATYAGKNHAVITVEVAPIRYRVDGTDPTASVGHLVAVGGVIVLESGSDVSNFAAIRSTGSSATLMVTFDKRNALRGY